jgi:Integrase core domain
LRASDAGADAAPIPDDQASRPTDLVDRDFSADAPNRLWVADFSYVMTWTGVVYVAFVIDAFSRRIVGWKADSAMKTSLGSTRWRWRCRRVTPDTFVIFAVGPEAQIDGSGFDAAVDRAAKRFAELDLT